MHLPWSKRSLSVTKSVPLLARCVIAFGFALGWLYLTTPAEVAPSLESANQAPATAAATPADALPTCGESILALGLPATLTPQSTGSEGSPVAVTATNPPLPPTEVANTAPSWFAPTSNLIALRAYPGQADFEINGVAFPIPADISADMVSTDEGVLLINPNNGTAVKAAVLTSWGDDSQEVADQWGIICVTVDQDKIPSQVGVYNGSFDIQAPLPYGSTTLDVVLEVVPKPPLTVLPTTWTESNWVDCRSFLWKIDCKLAGFLFGERPDDLLKPSRFILEQPAQNTVPVSFDVPTPVLYLGDSVQPLIESPITVSPAAGDIPAGGQQSITVSANPAGIHPGRYRGSIDILVPGSQVSRLSIPVTLNVQTGPIWVIVALAVGIGTAQLLQWWERTGSKRRELYRRLDDVEFESRDLRTELNWKVEQRSLEIAKRSIQKQSPEAAEDHVGLAENRLALLKDLEQVQALAPLCTEADRAKIEGLARSVQLHLANNLDDQDQASDLMSQARTIIAGCSESAAITVDLGGSPTNWGANQSSQATTGLLARVGLILRRPLSSQVPWRYRTVWFVATLVIWGVLVWLGIEALYLNPSVTFTGGSIRQYIPLLAWGFGTQAVTRSVSSLFPR
jgi:hypothetical protein